MFSPKDRICHIHIRKAGIAAVLFFHDLCHDAHGDLLRKLSSKGQTDRRVHRLYLLGRKPFFQQGIFCNLYFRAAADHAEIRMGMG